MADIKKAASFYSDLLGIKGMQISPGRYYLPAGDVILALYDPKADGDDTEARPNPEPIYFSSADLEAVFARAKRLGGLSDAIGDGELPMGQIATRPWGERSFYMSDPFGNPLCFVDRNTVFTGS